MTKAELAWEIVEALLAHPQLREVVGPVLETQRAAMREAVLDVLETWRPEGGQP